MASSSILLVILGATTATRSVGGGAKASPENLLPFINQTLLWENWSIDTPHHVYFDN